MTKRKLRRLKRRFNRGYFSVLLAYTDDTPTVWHPTESAGPFAVLSHGAFRTRALAHRWAAYHLGPFHSYKLRHYRGEVP
jgi:hypothetical protein